MKRLQWGSALDQRGRMDALLIPLILVTVLFVVAAAFGGWAFTSRQDYKNNSDEKAAAAVTVAEAKTATKKDNEFVEKEKKPLSTYNGPAAFGSLVLQYPKTWSAYVDEKGTSPDRINNYFHPAFVPVVETATAYALRVQVLDDNYANVVKSFDSNVKNGKLKAAAYIPAKVPTVTGLRLDGEIASNKQGAIVIVPIRDKTLKIWTESPDFINDFNTIILPNYSFSE